MSKINRTSYLCDPERDSRGIGPYLHNSIVHDLCDRIDALNEKLRDLEAEILRIQTHETAAAHALDSTLTPEERAKFKELADENASLQHQLEVACAANRMLRADLNAARDEGAKATASVCLAQDQLDQIINAIKEIRP